jgi:hypothetical protein
MAASLSGLTGLTGLAAGLGLPMPQFGFSPDGLSKPEHRFLQKRVVNDDEEDEVPDDKNPEKFSGEFFGAKRRKPNDESGPDLNGEPESPMSLQKVQSKQGILKVEESLYR